MVGHAGRIALVEKARFPTQVTPELDTLGVSTSAGGSGRDDRAPEAVPADRRVALLWLRLLSAVLDVSRGRRAGNSGAEPEEIPVHGPTMMHDFAITDDHVET